MKGKSKTPLKQYGFAIGLSIGLACAGVVAWASATVPTEHKGLSVETLGKISEDSIIAQVGLEDSILLMRAITIAPGGQIAKHSHAEVPGIVKVISGEWIEGRDSGEKTYGPDTPEALLEDIDTVHWFYNRGSEPATAIVCDIKPAS